MAAISPQEHSAIAQVRSTFQTVNKLPQPGEYDIGFPLPRGILYVRVKLPANFPNSPPRIYVASTVAHPLIGDNQRINYPEQDAWSPKITLLGILQNIYQAFISNPPVSESEKIPKFKELLEQWNKSIEDEQDMIEFINSIEDVEKLIKQRDELLERNLEKVEENLRKREEYEGLVRQHAEEIQEIESMTGQLAGLMKDVEALNKQYSPQKVLEKLKEMETGFNKEAAEVLRKFMKREIDVEEFVQEYQVPMKRAKFIQIAREAGNINK